METPFDNLTDKDKLLLLASYDRLSASTPPEYVYERPSYKEFLGQSESEIGAFYDKELANLEKSISMAKTQYEATKKLQEEQQARTEKRTYATEDRNFADLLDSAQMGFAGRGTYTSGFRKGAAEEQAIDRTTNLDEIQQQFGDTTANRNLGYSQFLEKTDLQAESDRLALERARKKAIIENASSLADEEATSKQVAGSSGNQGWKRFLTSGGAA